MASEMPIDGRQLLIGDGPALLALRGTVGHLQLNRPDSANGLNIEMLEALQAALKRCVGEPRIRVVLLSGLGPNFCAGGDVHEFASKGDQLSNYIRRATALLQEVIGSMIHLDAPVVAAVQGYTAGGGGMGLMCASDLVLAAESAKFLAGATRVGMAQAVAVVGRGRKRGSGNARRESHRGGSVPQQRRARGLVGRPRKAFRAVLGKVKV
jgi:enoyl-CoA hydratase/carnithine racemase